MLQENEINIVLNSKKNRLVEILQGAALKYYTKTKKGVAELYSTTIYSLSLGQSL